MPASRASRNTSRAVDDLLQGHRVKAVARITELLWTKPDKILHCLAMVEGDDLVSATANDDAKGRWHKYWSRDSDVLDPRRQGAKVKFSAIPKYWSRDFLDYLAPDHKGDFDKLTDVGRNGVQTVFAFTMALSAAARLPTGSHNKEVFARFMENR